MGQNKIPCFKCIKYKVAIVPALFCESLFQNRIPISGALLLSDVYWLIIDFIDLLDNTQK